MLIIGGLGCHSQDTRAFTPKGIREFSELQVGDEVWGCDKQEVLARTHKPIRLVKTKILKKYEYDYSGKMINIRNKKYDLLVTPNHNILFKKVHTYAFDYVHADTLLENQQGKIPLCFTWKGKTRKTYDIYEFIKPKDKVWTKEHNKNYEGESHRKPHFAYYNSVKRKVLRKACVLKWKCKTRYTQGHYKKLPNEELHPFKTNDFLRLMGWYVSEGSVVNVIKKPTKYFQIRNTSHNHEIEALLNRMGLKYGKYENSSKFVIFHRDLGQFFKENCGEYSWGKKIPDNVKELSPCHLKCLFETLWKGDGSDGSQIYYTVSKKLAEDVAEICLKIGYGATIGCRSRKGGKIHGRQINSTHPCYEIHVSFCPKGYFNSFAAYEGHPAHAFTQDYSGKVWCFETDCGNFFTVRNGKISVSGNSGKTLSMTFTAYRKYLEGKHIYANYPLNEKYFPNYTYISSPDEVDFVGESNIGKDISEQEDVFFAFDEAWAWLDSRCSSRKRNRITASILLRTRKRNVDACLSSQSASQVDKRVRNCVDFYSLPDYDKKRDVCRVLVLSGGDKQPVKAYRFRASAIFPMYNTNSEIQYS